MFPEDKAALLTATLAQHGTPLGDPQTSEQRRMWDHITDAIETPREAKRLVGAFSVLERAVRGEICPYDVLGYAWIAAKSPVIREAMAAHIDDLVSDPSDSGFARRLQRRAANQSEPSAVEVLGEMAEPQRKTLELLFPRLSARSAEDEGTRLSKRRNLVRMLYLGNPPGMLRRNTIEELWQITDVAELEQKFRQWMNDGTLSAFIDRMDDLLPQLPDSGDDMIWPALARAFVREQDWANGPDAARGLADDAASALYRLVRRDALQQRRLLHIIDRLTSDEDLVLVPWLLRKNLFAHGMTHHQKVGRGGEVLDKGQTSMLLTRQIPHYADAILNGKALRRLPNLEAVYVLANTDNWSDALRSSF